MSCDGRLMVKKAVSTELLAISMVNCQSDVSNKDLNKQEMYVPMK